MQEVKMFYAMKFECFNAWDESFIRCNEVKILCMRWKRFNEMQRGKKVWWDAMR